MKLKLESILWYQTTSYIKFLLKSKNQHGIHSPFVYDLITKCFYDSKKKEAYKTLILYRNKTIQHKNIIFIINLIANHRVFKSKERKVSTITKNTKITLKKQKLLFRLISYFKPDTILELGTSIGLGTIAMSIANPSSQLITIEECPNTSKLAQRNFKEFGLQNIHLKSSTFEDFFKIKSSTKYDVVFINENHNKEDIINYFNFLSNKINNDSILIFDGIYWNIKITEAWNQIKENPKVTLSIDTYYWGFLFFRVEQEKQHFTIRV
ncbi:class I SAM-dependent methyltransferase [Flavobacteriaceae bacterium]|jgi:predicted O-methyltransferase YrrM|nr:class I SAM-dependent methyltransferase [Flavobacteriaceae bacterium]MDB9993321.1 class I SAM-dependent methyltransferase [Flavobacteriaceae bacterium]